MLLYALRDLDIPIVLIGASHDETYRDLCQKFAPRNTLFLKHTEGALLPSAYAAARVHALPSWLETPGLVNLEAALCDCSLVVGDRATEWEYFQEGAWYCNPAEVESIRQAVVRAYETHDSPEENTRRANLKERILSEFTWERSAGRMLKAYETCRSARRRGQETLAEPTHETCRSAHRWGQEMPIHRAFRSLGTLAEPNLAEPGVPPTHSIIIVTYNSTAVLPGCWRSLLAHTDTQHEVFFIDNASTDGTQALLRDYARRFPDRVSMLLNAENLGFAAAANQGIRASRGQYLILLNLGNQTTMVYNAIGQHVAHVDALSTRSAIESVCSTRTVVALPTPTKPMARSSRSAVARWIPSGLGDRWGITGTSRHGYM